MIVYTVHEPPDAPIDRVDRADALTFISDRFSPLAAAFGAFWLLAHRIWLGLAIYACAFAAILLVIFVVGLGPGWLSVLVGALNLILGFEAASLQRLALERRGWRTLGTVSGRNIAECERRFLATWLPDQRFNSNAPASPSTAPPLSAMADGNSSGRLGRSSLRDWLPWPAQR